MWLITQYQGSQEERERLLDLLFQISPDLFLSPGLGQEGFIFISLAKVSQYWQLPSFHEAEHPLRQLLERLIIQEKLKFVLAPSAPWAHFLFHVSENEEKLQSFHREDCQRLVEDMPPSVATHFIADLFSSTTATTRAEWNFFTESLEYLGFKRLPDFIKFCLEPIQLAQMTERLGILPKKIFERLRFKDDFPLKLYVPSLQLKQTFYPDLEKQIDSPAKADILERLREILEEWEERLRLRKSLIKGFEVILTSNRKRCRKTLCLSLPRPTREAKTLFRLLQEKWLGATNAFTDDDDLKTFLFEEVQITSLGLQFESDRQLHLFDPKREDRAEEWSLLVGTLAGLGQDVRVGHYAAHPSYWPEFSVEWQSWSESDFVSFVDDHPRRPLVLLSPPRPLREPACLSEEDFLEFLVQQRCLESLERISDPWRGQERSYARLPRQWIYWDHKKKQCFVHGLDAAF